MATVKLVDELRETFTECTICMTDYTSPPKMLMPCLHTFCLACLERHASGVRRGNPLLCPTCRTPVDVPDDGLAALPTNFFVNRLRDSLRESNKVDEEACAAHADKPACFLCRTCNEAICAGCMLTAGHRSHDCVEIDEASATQKTVLRVSSFVNARVVEGRGVQERGVRGEGCPNQLPSSIMTKFNGSFRGVLLNEKLFFSTIPSQFPLQTYICTAE